VGTTLHSTRARARGGCSTARAVGGVGLVQRPLRKGPVIIIMLIIIIYMVIIIIIVVIILLYWRNARVCAHTRVPNCKLPTSLSPYG